MLKPFVILLFLISPMVCAVTVIDNARRSDLIKINNEDDNNDIDVNQDDECSKLAPELIEEIKSHQSIVDNIVGAIVKGKYSGDTWNA